MSQANLWVVVADGEHARILVSGEKSGSYRTSQSLDSISAHKRSSDLGSDAPGRSYESASPSRHAVEARTDLHAKAERSFLGEVARLVNDGCSQGEFQRLVLVAPSRAMHTLRDALLPSAAERVVGLLQKDLNKVPDAEIGDHLTWDVLHSAAGARS
jgi:protein required for attachment to host cells